MSKSVFEESHPGGSSANPESKSVADGFTDQHLF